MTLGETFPRTAAAWPDLLRWDAHFAWAGDSPAAIAQLLIEKMVELQMQGRGALLEFAKLVRLDLTDETTRVADGDGAAQIDAVRFLVSSPAIATTIALGQNGDCYSWLHWSACRTHVFDARTNRGQYRLPPFDGASARANQFCRAHLTDWISAAFMIARKLGGMDQWCADIADFCIGHVVDEIVAGLPEDDRVTAIVTIANWATDRDDPHAEPLVRSLAAMFDRLAPRARATVAMLFTTSASRWTGRTHQEWARLALDELRPVLVEHEALQFLSVTLDTLDHWVAARTEVLAEIRTLVAQYRAGEAADQAPLALEARVSIIHPLIFSLAEYGTVDDIVDVLWAWYGNDDHDRPDANVLFVGSAHRHGVAYLWPGGRLHVGEEQPVATLQLLLDALSAALNEYFRGPDGDRGRPLDDRMIGAPAFDMADDLVRAMSGHYRLDALEAALPQGWRPRSIIVLPAHRDPLQALLAERLGWLAPLEASVTAGQDRREIRRLSVWPGETHTTEAEVSFLAAVAQQFGWTVKVVAGPLDAAAFQTFYEDVEADLLWVIGHGAQSPFRQNESGLILAGGEVLTSAQISGFAQPNDGRRLLVLNICSATATQNRGGLARIGFGHDLTTAAQTVVGHLWPIDYFAALAFGCSFALDLGSLGPADALKSAVDRMQTPATLLHDLERLHPHAPALDRLRSDRAAERISNILSWGSPVLLT